MNSIGSLCLDSEGFIVFSKSTKKTLSNFVLTEFCLDKQNLVKVLTSAMSNMSELQKKVTLLLYYEGLNVTETSAVLNITIQDVLNINMEVVSRLQESISNIGDI